MSTPLVIFAHIEAKPDQIDLVKSELMKLIAPTQVEDGCILYDLHQDNDNPAVFKFYEQWVSRELWQAHMASDHLAAYVKATDGAVVDFAVHEMSLVGG